MKKCAFFAAVAGMVCLLMPVASQAATPQTRPIPVRPHAAVRHAPKPPRRDQLKRGGLDGSLIPIQFISTRRSRDPGRDDRALPQDDAAQVRASREGAARHSPSTSIARIVDSLPPHWGATHLSI